MKKSGGKYAIMRIAVMRNNYGGVCQINGCKEKENLQFAHRIATKISGSSRGSWIRLRDITDNPLFYVLLYDQHHLEWDGKQKLKDEIKPINPIYLENKEKYKESLFIEVIKSLQTTEKKPVEKRTLIVELIKTGKFTINDCFVHISKLQRNAVIYESKPNYYNLVDENG